MRMLIAKNVQSCRLRREKNHHGTAHTQQARGNICANTHHNHRHKIIVVVVVVVVVGGGGVVLILLSIITNMVIVVILGPVAVAGVTTAIVQTLRITTRQLQSHDAAASQRLERTHHQKNTI